MVDNPTEIKKIEALHSEVLKVMQQMVSMSSSNTLHMNNAEWPIERVEKQL